MNDATGREGAPYPTVEGSSGSAVSGAVDGVAADGTRTVPLVEERLVVEKRAVERTAIVQLRTREEDVRVNETLSREHVDVERVPLDLIVNEPPAIREEGDLTVIPIVEEVLVRRFRVIEELHLRRRVETVEVDETVTLRQQRVHIQEDGSDERSDP